MSSISKVNVSVINGEVSGFYDPQFERVAEEFVRNFQERGEVGASVCIKLEGETVVDLWGGIARPDTQTPWVEDTLSVIWSTTKGATALCAHILASRGLLDLDAPVTTYWPEFGQAGKENISVKMLLNHQSGLPALSEPLPPGAFYDWELMVRMLEKQAPFWTPGSMHGYHAFTFGWLVGELVRRISGKSLGTFFREEVAEPLGLDFWIGLPEELEDRVAVIIPAPPPDPGGPVSAMFAAMVDPTSLQTLLRQRHIERARIGRYVCSARQWRQPEWCRPCEQEYPGTHGSRLFSKRPGYVLTHSLPFHAGLYEIC